MREGGGGVAFAEIPALFGLGVLFSTEATWSQDLAGFVIPWHENRLLRTLEENRLRNYLAVIDWQDRMAASKAA